MVHSAPMVTPTGSFQVPVVRFFKEETYATQFAQEGRARFTCQESYHDSPDEARRDDTEGTGRLARGNLPLVRVNKTPLSAELEVITTNPVYVLCFSEASADLMTLKRQFGTYVVRIEDPELLNGGLPALKVESLPIDRQIVGFQVCQIRYDKDLVREVREIRDAISLAFRQKPPKHAHEREWRIVLVLSGTKDGAPEHLHATLPMARKLTVSLL